MVVEPGRLATALGLPPETIVALEPLGEAEHAPVRAVLRAPGHEPLPVLVRTSPDPEAEANNTAVLDALTHSGFKAIPRLEALYGDAAVESWIDGVTALAVVPPAGSLEAAVTALAQMHELPVREGLRWERSPGDWLGEQELPLYRLGFTSAERDAAREPLASAIAELRAGPWGFTHGHCTAANVLLAPGSAWLTDFGSGGFGPQLFDIAGFLLTAGLDGEQRAALAGSYGSLRGWKPAETAAAVEIAGILWGLEELLGLPRRLIEALGDDALSASLRTAAGRIERGLLEAAGNSGVAREIRAALWG